MSNNQNYRRPYEMIDEIIKEFDYDRVHNCMVALNWKWALAVNSRYGGLSVYQTPDIETLQIANMEHLYGLVQEAECDSRATCDCQIRTGGFRYEVYKKNNVITDIILSFVVTDWSTNNIEESYE